MNKGKIIQVMGPVVDVSFEGGVLPALYNAINIERTGESGEMETLVCEVALHLGDNAVRSVAMHSTDGLVRGMEAIDTGSPGLGLTSITCSGENCIIVTNIAGVETTAVTVGTY